MRKLKQTGLLTLLALGIGVGCEYYDYDNAGGDLWDTSIAAANDGVYINLPVVGNLIRIGVGEGTFSGVKIIDLNGASPERLVTSPDGTKVLVFASWLECKDDSKDVVYFEDCDYEDRIEHSILDIVSDGSLTNEIAIPSHLNTVSFSNDGQIAVAYLDYQNDSDIEVEGFADLGEVAFIRLEDGTKGSASVGFSPSEILFSPDGQAVVMSRSQVVAVDLETFERTLEAPLTLDADQAINPSDAELAFDADSGVSTFLLTVQGSSDLYMLDLESKFWNIGDLGATPSDIGVDNASSQSVFVFGSSSKAVILDHSELSTLNASSLEDVDLEEPANAVQIGDGFAILYNDYNDYVHDVYKLNLETKELTEYVVGNPVSALSITPSGRYAVSIDRPEYATGSGIDYYQDSRWGLSIMDLSGDDVVSLVAESKPIGLALVEDEENSYALALLEGSDTLLQVNLANPTSADEVALPAAPVSIASMPDGNFAISHDQGLGMVSVLDPNSLELKTVSNFAAINLFEQKELPRRNGEE
jgi:DNA-binding beta-propeller fold protein YncE